MWVSGKYRSSEVRLLLTEANIKTDRSVLKMKRYGCRDPHDRLLCIRVSLELMDLGYAHENR